MMSTDIQYALWGEVEGKQLHNFKPTSVKYIGLLSKEFHFTTHVCAVGGRVLLALALANLA